MKIDARDLLQMARTGRPSVTYALNVEHTVIAAYVEGTWHGVAGKLLTGEWVSMPVELLINGQRMPFTPDTTC